MDEPPESSLTTARPDDADETEVDRIVAAGPAGALALSGLSIAFLLLIWFAFYFFVFLPRGPSG
jgi:hypothetical protein